MRLLVTCSSGFEPDAKRELEEILEVVTALVQEQRGEHPRGSPIAIDEGMDPDQWMRPASRGLWSSLRADELM